MSFFDISSLKEAKKNAFSRTQNCLKSKISTLEGLHLVPKIGLNILVCLLQCWTCLSEDFQSCHKKVRLYFTIFYYTTSCSLGKVYGLQPLSCGNSRFLRFSSKIWHQKLAPKQNKIYQLKLILVEISSENAHSRPHW